MEIEILDHHGIAADSVISIRAGKTRRQAKLSSGLPFHFPTLPVSADPFKFEVLQPVNSKNLTLSPDAERYIVKFQESRLELLIQAKTSANASSAKPSRPEAEATRGHREPSRPKAEATEAVDPDADDVTGEEGRSKKAANASAKEYLEQHNMMNYMQEMLAALVQSKPEDPFEFMSSYAGRTSGESGNSAFGESADPDPEIRASQPSTIGL
eukprot:gnl/TRDRNA2_/TRDRNA2_197679_c0_seq1.p1 gnl/TRDRNA2_/TRDRNA2_197679_c0~~gnl/TRDRNA2_/TRDRNA2_197679_c0_seq1.p1  ORF type:complete len:212 (-),score=44.15 gnl/TRDRNA2_/TRDRNA2_197679_c0_seq1:22-657(-)